MKAPKFTEAQKAFILKQGEGTSGGQVSRLNTCPTALLRISQNSRAEAIVTGDSSVFVTPPPPYPIDNIEFLRGIFDTPPQRTHHVKNAWTQRHATFQRRAAGGVLIFRAAMSGTGGFLRRHR